MDLHFTTSDSARHTLAQQVTQAQCLATLPHLLEALARRGRQVGDSPDHNYPCPAHRQAAFLRGLVDGLQGIVSTDGRPAGLPGIPPEQSPSYDDGYGQGQGLRGVVQAWEQAQRKAEEADHGSTATACLNPSLPDGV